MILLPYRSTLAEIHTPNCISKLHFYYLFIYLFQYLYLQVVLYSTTLYKRLMNKPFSPKCCFFINLYTVARSSQRLFFIVCFIVIHLTNSCLIRQKCLCRSGLALEAFIIPRFNHLHCFQLA